MSEDERLRQLCQQSDVEAASALMRSALRRHHFADLAIAMGELYNATQGVQMRRRALEAPVLALHKQLLLSHETTERAQLIDGLDTSPSYSVRNLASRLRTLGERLVGERFMVVEKLSGGLEIGQDMSSTAENGQVLICRVPYWHNAPISSTLEELLRTLPGQPPLLHLESFGAIGGTHLMIEAIPGEGVPLSRAAPLETKVLWDLVHELTRTVRSIFSLDNDLRGFQLHPDLIFISPESGVLHAAFARWSLFVEPYYGQVPSSFTFDNHRPFTADLSRGWAPAPEFIRGERELYVYRGAEKAVVFLLGLILRLCLVGFDKLSGAGDALKRLIGEEPWPSVEGEPEWVSLSMRCMQSAPEDRPSLEDVWSALSHPELPKTHFEP